MPGLGKSPGEEHGYPPPLFLHGEFHGQRILVGYSPWGHKQSDTTKQPTHTHKNEGKVFIFDSISSFCYEVRKCIFYGDTFSKVC